MLRRHHLERDLHLRAHTAHALNLFVSPTAVPSTRADEEHGCHVGDSEPAGEERGDEGDGADGEYRELGTGQAEEDAASGET